MEHEMRRKIIVAILLSFVVFQQANASDSIIKNEHSVESIKAALSSPIPYDIQKKAQ
jgi:hypothetical protein